MPTTKDTAPTKSVVSIYVRLGHNEDEAERTIAFRIPEDVDQMELLEHGFAIDGRDAIFTVAQEVNNYSGETYYDAPFGKQAATLSGALNLAQRDLVAYLREHGCDPKFA